MNKKTSLIIVAVLALLGIIGGWYAYANYQNQQATAEAEQYVSYRQDSLAAIQDIKLSEMINDDASRADIDAQKAACKNLDGLVDEIPADVKQADQTAVSDAESKYSLNDWRHDVERYRDICWYSVTYDDYSDKIETALASAEHQKFLLDLPDCSYGLCFKPELSQQYHQWRSENILKPYQANKDFYRSKDCPLAIDGGEQYCTALANYASAYTNYEQLYLQQIARDELTPNDPDMLREYEALNGSYQSLQRITAAVGDFDDPYQLYRAELQGIEKQFADRL